MTITGKVKFYDVEECGFYERGADGPRFGRFSELTADFERWVSEDADRVHATKTFNAQEDDAEGELPAYCLDFRRSQANGDCLLVLWNEVESTDGKVASLDPNSAVGASPRNSIATTDTPGSNIPGYATYFWLLPEHGRFAGIRFQHNYFRVPRFRTYMRQFAVTRSRFVAKKSRNDRIEILGYRDDPNDEPESLKPRFETSPQKVGGKVEALKERCNEIRKIIRIVNLERENPLHHGLAQRLLKSVGLHEQKEDWADRRFDASLNVDGIEKRRFEELVNQWESDDLEGRIGFKITSETRTYWLDEAEVKREVDFPIGRANVELVETNALFAQLQARRAELLEEGGGDG